MELDYDTKKLLEDIDTHIKELNNLFFVATSKNIIVNVDIHSFFGGGLTLAWTASKLLTPPPITYSGMPPPRNFTRNI